MSAPTGHASSSLELISGTGFVQRVLTFSPSRGLPQSPGNKANRSQAALSDAFLPGEVQEAKRPRRSKPRSSKLQDSTLSAEFSPKSPSQHQCLFFSLELGVRAVLGTKPGNQTFRKAF